jgi:hypothetical protein
VSRVRSILAAVAALGLALLLSACGNTSAMVKAQTAAAIAVGSGYRALGDVEVTRLAAIKVKYADDHVAGRAALERHQVRYNVAKAAIDTLEDVVADSQRDGMTMALIGPMVSGALKIKEAIEALKGGD